MFLECFNNMKTTNESKRMLRYEFPYHFAIKGGNKIYIIYSSIKN